MTNSTGGQTIAGVFTNPAHAELVVDRLRAAGVPADRISLLARDARESREIKERAAGGDAEGSPKAGTGTVVGGLLGGLVTLAALALPGVGPVFAGGALAAALTGTAMGAVAGGVVGALTDAGIPEAAAKKYQVDVEQGYLLLTIGASSAEDAGRIADLLREQGASDVKTYARGGADMPGQSAAARAMSDAVVRSNDISRPDR